MSDVIGRNGRVRVAFGDVVRLSRERSTNPEKDGLERFVGLEHIEPGDLKIRHWGNVSDGTTFTNVFHAGQVLFGKRRAYQRKVALAEFDGVCSGDIYVLETKSAHLLPELLPFVCQTDVFFEHAVRTSVGSLSPRTNWDSLATYEFILPSHNEQQRISCLLTTMESALEAYHRVLAGALTVRGALLSHWILGASVSDFNGELSEELLAPGWRLLPASDLCGALITKGATPSEELTSRDTGIPFLKVYNLTFDGTLDFSIDPTFVTRKGHTELQRSTVLPGDVLMNIVGPPLGKVTLVPIDFAEGNINQAIARFRPARPEMASWLTVFLLSPIAQNWLMARSKKTSGQRNLTLETCRELLVAVPPDDRLPEIIGHLAHFETNIKQVEMRLAQATALRQKIAAATLGV